MTKADSAFNKGRAAHRRGDYKTAWKLWKPLADDGHAEAQSWIGVMYDNGDGVKTDFKEAVKWYRRGAAQGSLEGIYNLGNVHDHGRGVRKSHKEALKWYLKAANRGDLEAQRNLSSKYRHGVGTKRDFVRAYMWSLLFEVGRGQLKSVNSRCTYPPAVSLAKQMTPAQIKKAKRLAMKWKPSPAPQKPSEIEQLIRAEKWTAARKLISRRLRIEPDNHWLLTRLALTYYEQRRYKQALNYDRQALAEMSDCPLVLWGYAGSLDMLGEKKTALKVYQRLIRRGVEKIAFGDCGEGLSWARELIADCHYRAAKCYRALGQYDLAKRSYKNHIALRGPGCRSIYSLSAVRGMARALRAEAK